MVLYSAYFKPMIDNEVLTWNERCDNHLFKICKPRRSGVIRIAIGF